MKIGKRGFARRFTASLVLALFMSQVSLPMWGTTEAWAVVGTNVKAPLKNYPNNVDVGMEETDDVSGGTRKSNVLFLIEATAAMSFTPKGVLPQVQMITRWNDSYREGADWNKTFQRFGYKPRDIDRMMVDATFGMGALPTAWSGRNLRPERNLYGRERLDTNNFKRQGNLSDDIKVNSEDYYFPFLTEDNPISDGLYSGQTTKLEIGFENYPQMWPKATTNTASTSSSGYPTGVLGSYLNASSIWYHDTKYQASDKGYYKMATVNVKTGTFSGIISARHIHDILGTGDQIVADYDYKGKASARSAYPYAMVFKDPAHWKSPPASWTSDDLVPNDSRMYQTKLVLWRLLSDADLFKNIRFGMATTFLSPANTELGAMAGTHFGVTNHRQDYNGIFKVYPFGANIWTISIFDKTKESDPNGNALININANTDAYHNNYDRYERIQFTNGVLGPDTTGQMETHASIFGQYYPMWMNAKVQSFYDTINTNGQEPDGWWAYSGHIDGELRDRPMYKMMNRASLWLPITEHNHSWQKGGKSIDHIEKFKMWINGVADIKSAGDPSFGTTGGTNSHGSGQHDDLTDSERNNQFHYYNDPEIGIAGNFAIAQAIFQDPTKNHPTKGNALNLDRDYYIKNGFVWYSKKDKNINYRADFRRFSQEQYYSGIPRGRYNAGSGEAAGSAIDFFSPRTDFAIDDSPDGKDSHLGRNLNSYSEIWANNTTGGQTNGSSASLQVYDSSDGHTVSVDDLDDLSFPIRSTCEDNWLIVVASGTEPKTTPGEYSYGAWEAVKNLYDSTDAAQSQDQTLTTGPRKAAYEQSTMITKTSGGGRTLSKVDLENPIRTLVIGIVANENDPEVKDNPNVLKEVKRMRLNLIKMANAGQGEDPSGYTEDNMYTAPHQPFFATNSTELLEAFRNALVAVNKSEVTQPGKGSLIETQPSEGEDLPSMYSTSYRIVQGDQWNGYLTRYTVSDDEDGSSTLTEKWEFDDKLRADRGTNGAMNRKIKYWDKVAGNFKLISEGNTALNDLLGANSKISVSDPDSAVMPDKALYYWLQGYDYSYASKAKYPRSSMLADFGNSGIVYADYPSVEANNGLPGYKEWAENLKATPTAGTERLYAQTNDGILHVILPLSGDEEAAILPPPTLLPSRLASLKTDASGKWHNGKSGDKALGTRSNPGFMLDGPLQKRRFDLSEGMAGTDWRTLLLGTLGRGGNGLYMLDITHPNAPKFLWYRENIGGSAASMAAADSEPALDTTVTNPYLKLGFNSPKPAMGIAGTMGGVQTNFIALPGGSQSSYDPDQNGKEGSVFLFINPKDGSVIRAFDSAAVGSSTAKLGSGTEGEAPYMGMMVSEPTLLRSQLDSNSYMTGRVFAEDNRGNIFMVSMEDDIDGATQTLLKDNWNIRMVATLQKDRSSANSLPLSYATPYGLAASYVNKKIWLGGGTSNVMTKISPDAPKGEIKNDFQMIFGLRVPDQKTDTLVRDEDLKKFEIPSEDKLESSETEQYSGWFFKLRPEEQNNGEEYVSAKPLMINGVMFIATFREMRRIDTSNSNPCGITRSVAGEARIYAVDIRTGAAGHWTAGAKWETLEDEKVVEIFTRRNSKKPGKTEVWFRKDVFGNGQTPKKRDPKLYKKGPNIDATDVDNGGGGRSFPPEKSVILYWYSK
jgi:Tfp pilus tip-associated adhesin PilY1